MYTIDDFTWESSKRRSFASISQSERPATLQFMVHTIQGDATKNSKIHLFGTTDAGDSVHCSVTGFLHYFWLEKPASIHQNHLADLLAFWNNEIRSSRQWDNAKDPFPLANIEIHRREPGIYYKGADYQGEEMLMVTLSRPKDLYDARRFFNRERIPLPYSTWCPQLTMYEEDGVSYAGRFMCDLNVVGFGWVAVFQYSLTKSSRCTWDITASANHIKGFTPDDGSSGGIADGADYGRIAPFRTFDFDIECAATKGFPTADKDPVIQIAVQVHEIGSKGKRLITDTVLFTKQTTHLGEGVIMAEYTSEAKMLLGFVALANACDYDISRNFNGRGFDWPYLFDRAKVLGIEAEFSAISRLQGAAAKISSSTFESGARGKRSYRDADIPGRADFDICDIVRREEKLKSYRLNSVCMAFLTDPTTGKIMTKEDVHHSMITTLYNGSPDDRARLAKYCRKDAMLCRIIDEKRMYLIRYIEQARVCRVTLEDLVQRGQQIKVLSQLLRLAKEFKVVLPLKRYLTNHHPDGQYEGGLVLEPDVGYWTKPICCLDFSSLYPSEDISENLDYLTLLKPQDAVKMDPKDVFKGPTGHYFVREHVRKGMLCILLERLLNARSVAKGDVKKANAEAARLHAAGDHEGAERKLHEASVQDARQIAIKLAANSAYGFTGVKLEQGGCYPCFEVSETITACGRRDLMQIVEYVHEHYPSAKVKYGDSVTGDTPVIVRRANGVIDIVRCDELLLDGNWQNEEADDTGECKQTIHNPAVEVWSDAGFQVVKRFIRHRCHKPIYRVLTHTGMVDATSDHSLLLKNGLEVSPAHVTVGTALLHTTTTNIPLSAANQPTTIISPNEAFAMGLFMADGSCGAYDTQWGVKHSWAINNQDLDLLHLTMSRLPFQTKILDTLESSHVYKLVPIGNIKDPTIRYRKLFYNQAREKIVPNDILWASYDVKKAFCDGFYAGDGSRKEKEKQTIHRFSHNGKQAAMGLWMLHESLDYKISLNTRTDKTNSFKLSMTTSYQRKPVDVIKKVELLHQEYNDYVYDFETENHHFHVGPGNLVVHNTDSIMVEPGVETVKEAMEWMHRVAKEINAALFAARKPMKLAPEKVMFPTEFQSKKHYCIHGDSLITLDCGLAVPISTLSGAVGIRTKVCDESMIQFGETVAGGYEGRKECLRITLHDGRTLDVTRDHEIYTPLGFIKAADLEPGCLVTMDIDPVPDIKCPLEDIFHTVCSIPELDMRTVSGRAKALAFFRLFGLLCSDGSFNGGCNVVVFVGTAMDAEQVRKDVKMLYDFDSSINCYNGIYRCSLTMRFIHDINRFTTFFSGKKMSVGMPDITFHRFPKSIIREFLAGLFGGDGSSQHILFQKSGPSVSRIHMSLLCLDALKLNMEQFMTNITRHLQLFGLSSHLHGPYHRNHELHEQLGHVVPHDYMENPRLSYTVDIDQTSLFISTIGYRYCVKKSLRSSVLSSFVRHRENLSRQRAHIARAALELEARGLKKNIQIVADDMELREHILNRDFVTFQGHYPQKKSLQKAISSSGEKNRDIVLIRSSSKIKLLSLNEHIRLTGAAHFFQIGDGKNSDKHRQHVQIDIDHRSPTYTMQVVDIRSIGYHDVYDLTVPSTTSYIANGVVVHNCAGYYESNPDVPDKVYYRGIEVVRRDACDLMSECLEGCCNLIFKEQKIDEAVALAKKTIQDLYLNEIDMSKLLMSKTLSQDVEDYKSPQAHTVLAAKMAKRDPASAPAVGDRVTYVMVGEGGKQVRDLAEDPIYALENEIPINVEYYIENQLKEPLKRLFIPIIGPQRTGEIFVGEHTRKRVRPQQAPAKASRASIMSFITVQRACASCATPYDPEIHRHPSLCPNCTERHGPQALEKKKRKFIEIEEAYTTQFAVCQTCQGSDRDPVLCMARDCPELYKRKGLEFKYKRATKDIEDMGLMCAVPK